VSRYRAGGLLSGNGELTPEMEHAHMVDPGSRLSDRPDARRPTTDPKL